MIKLLTTLITVITIATTNLVATVTVPDIQDEITVDYDEYTEEYVYVSVSAKAVGINEIIPGGEVLFCEQNCAEIIVDLIEQNGLDPIYYGSTDQDFYLASIHGIDTEKAIISDEMRAFLSENDVEISDTPSEADSLGEFDFTNSSGWMYLVNGEIPDVGMNNYIPEPGDEIMLVFTLLYGEDIPLVY